MATSLIDDKAKPESTDRHWPFVCAGLQRLAMRDDAGTGFGGVRRRLSSREDPGLRGAWVFAGLRPGGLGGGARAWCRAVQVTRTTECRLVSI